MLTRIDLGRNSDMPELAGSEAARRDIIHRYPLPATVPALEVFSEVVEIRDLHVHAVGISAATETLGEVTGAAADLEAASFERAYFELLERFAVTESSGRGRGASGGGPARMAPWRESVSNGVALQLNSERAARAAALEIIERDRVLRSWYGGARPGRSDVLLPPWVTSLRADYELVGLRFREGLNFSSEEVFVAGIIGFPRHSRAALSMGFAARGSFEEALEAASRELLQQIVFGWGEPVAAESPEVAPTPEFHLDFYSYPGNHHLLEAWLDGANEGRGPELPRTTGEFRFQDITPAWMRGGLHVVRAEHPSAVPLVFGIGHPWFPDLPECMRVQPIA